MENQLTPLQWLAQQHYEEQRALRAAEDNLFSWSSSILLAGLGALTGFRGMSDRAWGFWWRMLLMIAVIVIISAILLMAYLLHRRYERNEAQLAQILTQLGTPPARQGTAVEDQLFFFVRWGALGMLGLATEGLVWLLG